MLTTRQLMKALGVGRTCITRYLAAGCPHSRSGDYATAPLRFDLEDVRGWLEATARDGQLGNEFVTSTPRLKVAQERNQAEILHDMIHGPSVHIREHAPAAATAVAEPVAAPAEDEDENLLELARRVNIEIKRLEVQKRTRLEAEAEGQLVPLDDVRRAWLAQVEVVHARFRSLPSLVATRLVGKDYDAIRDVLEEELRSVLLSFARESLDV